MVGRKHQIALCIIQNLETQVSLTTYHTTEIVSRGKVSRYQPTGFQLHLPPVTRLYREPTAPDGSELFSRKDRFGAHRTIFLAHDTGPVHGPRKTPPPIHEGRSQADRSHRSEAVFPVLFIQGNWSDGGSGAKMPAGDTVVLAPTCAGAKIQNRRPEAFYPRLEKGRVDNIRRTDSHALAALDAALEEIFFGLRPGRTYHAGRPIGRQRGVKAHHGHRGYS
jgi:hypothetical protein